MRQYEIAVLSALLNDELGEYITHTDITSDLFSQELRGIAGRIIQYKKDGGTFDIVLIHKLIDNTAVCREIIEASSKIVIQSAPTYLRELKYANFEKLFFNKMNNGERPTPDDLRKGLDILNDGKEASTIYDFHRPVSLWMDTLYDDKAKYHNTGIKSIDDILGRILPEDGPMISIGGATGLGKTTMATRILANFMLKDVPCLYMSCEMGFDSLFGKIVAQNSCNISAFKMRNHCLSEREKLEAKSVAERFYKKKSLVNITGRFNIPEIKRLIQKNGSQVIFIDFVQNFRLDLARGHNPASANSELAKTVKEIATETKTVIFCLSQLNTIGNLRESSSWEDKSDVVCKMFATKRKEKQGNTEIEVLCENQLVKGIDFVISKNRYGDSGKIQMLLNKITTNIAPGEGIWE